jgi:hypothetical protein
VKIIDENDEHKYWEKDKVMNEDDIIRIRKHAMNYQSDNEEEVDEE